MRMFVGVDWASANHAVCIVDETGGIRAQLSAAHSAAGLAGLLTQLRRFGEPATLPIAIERPTGLLVDTLVDAGFPVYPVHPNAVKACRARYRAAGSKSDPHDAYVLADVLRTDGHRLRPVRPQRLAAFLAQTGYCGRRTPPELLARLHAAPAGQAAAAEAAAKGEIVRALVTTLTALGTELQRVTAAVEHALATHPDGPLVMAFPRAGRVNAAQILAELGDDRGRFTSDAHLAAEAGVAPVTYRSGKQHGVRFRWACNKRLRQALVCFADNSRRSSPWAAAVYARARGRGCDHPHAVRILARAWVRVLWRCWQTRIPYDLTKHRAARLMIEAA